MDNQEILMRLLEQNQGYLLTAEVLEHHVSKPCLEEFVRRNGLERAAHGVYVSEDVWLDDLYLIRLRSKAAVFSHETALWLHGLTEHEPSAICLTVPRTYNASAFRQQGCKVYTADSELHGMGRMSVETNLGHQVQAYDMDRTFCDMVKQKEKMDIQVFRTAVQAYMHSPRKNLPNLMRYAKAMHLQDKVRVYTEVML